MEMIAHLGEDDRAGAMRTVLVVKERPVPLVVEDAVRAVGGVPAGGTYFDPSQPSPPSPLNTGRPKRIEFIPN